MGNFKKGDMVGRISYGKDVIFEVHKIIKTSNNKEFAILKGITERIEADAPIEDLELVDKRILEDRIRDFESKMSKRIEVCLKNPSYCFCKTSKNLLSSLFRKDTNDYDNKRSIKVLSTGKILHLDGDRRYSEKSVKYYKSLGLDAVVKNIAESKQPLMVTSLLEKYKPDVLVITGHDGMIRKGTKFNDIYNYRNSKYFINSVIEARKWAEARNRKDLSIFAGACQSFYEGIMSAGANFASSPARIMIDFIDPLIVAERIATTEKTKFLTINDIKDELRDGEKGVSGIGSMGKKIIILE